MEIKKIETPVFGTNCYLLENEQCALIIDPGELTPELVAFCQNNYNKPQKAILLTHCHFDHIGALDDTRKLFDAKVYISDIGNKGLSDPDINVSRFLTGTPFTVKGADVFLNDNDVLDFGGEKIKVMATPGHTACSVCFILDDKIFSGDTIFKMNIGRYDLPTSNPRQLLESLNRIKKLKGDYRIYSGHGEDTTLEYERKNNPYLKD